MGGERNAWTRALGAMDDDRAGHLLHARHDPSRVRGGLEQVVTAFLAYVTGCTIIAALTLIHPDNARWFALAILGVLFVCSALPRRKAGRR